MTTYNPRRKKGFRWLFALVSITTLSISYVALGAGPAFRNSGSVRSGSHRQHPVSRPLRRSGFFGGDGLNDQNVIIIQPVQAAPSIKPEPTESRRYVPPQWVDGGYGVQVLQPSYWTVPKQAAQH